MVHRTVPMKVITLSVKQQLRYLSTTDEAKTCVSCNRRMYESNVFVKGQVLSSQAIFEIYLH